MLTTLDRLKNTVKIAFLEDDQLVFLIRAASADILRYLDRPLERQSLTETLNGSSSSKFLNLSLYPVQSVTSVQAWTEIIQDSVLVKESGRLYRAKGWPAGVLNIVVSYDGGYVLPGEEGADLPEDIELACILRVQELMRQPGVTSERVGDISVTYEGGEMSSAVRSLLDGHRRYA